MNHLSAIARLTPFVCYFLLHNFSNILPATAQIVPDNTLGNESSLVSPDTINGIESDRIDGGAIRNSNLFHSFQEFNINEGRGAYFTNPSGIDNIFTRVTGSNLSNIFGTLGVLGNANLFLLNPNGIVFGPNARLDIGGSFIGSTAASILFDNGIEFSATNPQGVPLLTVNIPIGLNFRDNPGTIINQSVANSGSETVGLEVTQGQTLGLFGGNIELPGGNLTAPGGHIELSSITTAGTIGINSENNSLRFSFPDPPLTPLEKGGDRGTNLLLDRVSIIPGNISLNQATISVIDSNLGSITINAGNLDILASSRLIAGIQTSLGSAESQAGDITLNGANQVTINNSVVGNQVGFEAVGNSGNVNIQTNSLVLSDAGEINTLTLGSGNAGRVSIQANQVTLTGNNTAIYSNVDIPDSSENPDSFTTVSVGNSGGVEINTENLTLNDGAQIQSSTFGNGDAGGVTVQADESILLSGISTGIFSNANPNLANGNSGGIRLNGRSLSMTDGAQLQSNSNENGNSGKVQIQTQESVDLSGTNTAIFSNALSASRSGGIEITGAALSMTDGAQLVANSDGLGTAGTISISTPEGAVFLSDRNTAILSQSSLNVGVIGGINIDAGSLTLRNGAQIQSEGNSASIFVQTNGEQGAISLSGASTNILTHLTEGTGGIDLNSRDFSLTDGAQLVLSASPDSNGGKIAVAAENISLEGASTSVSSRGQGGNILLEGTTISMDDAAQVQSLSIGSGNGGGNISVQGNTVSLRNGAQVQSLTQGSGNGGNISVQGNNSVSLTGANTAIFSLVTEPPLTPPFEGGENSSGGNSGDITIEGDRFSLTDGAQLISATFGQGNAGKVSVNVNDDILLSGANTVIFSSVGSGADSERSIFPELDETTPDATAVGDSGGIDLRGRSLTLTDGAQITASTFDFQQGNAGDISIEMTENITLEGNSELNNPTPGEITQPTIANSFQNTALPSTANTPTVLVDSLVILETGITEDTTPKPSEPEITPTPTPTPTPEVTPTPTETPIPQVLGSSGEGASTGIFSTVETGAQGNAGNINLRSRFFSITNGAQVQTVTRGRGNAGTIRVEATDQVTVIGRSPDGHVASGLFSSAEETAVGQGGNVEIMTPELQISDGAGINARGLGENAAGSINIDATGDITLNNQAVLSAETASGTEGNINLRSDNLFLRNNSRITTDATGNATGGNITIDTNFVVARNNSDINANAEQSSGGQVIINAQGIFGTEFREGVFNTPESDITATSKLGLQFSGTVQLNTPDVDPTAGLIDLPENVVDPSALIAQNVCFQSATSQFIITGRGGVPPNPNDSLNPDLVQVDLVAPAPMNSGQVQTSANGQTLTQTVPRPIPAQGWIFNEKGEIVLTAESAHHQWQNLDSQLDSQTVRSLPSNLTCK